MYQSFHKKSPIDKFFKTSNIFLSIVARTTKRNNRGVQKLYFVKIKINNLKEKL